MTAYELNYFLTSCTSNWIVHEATYEANKKEEGGMIVTTYGTSMDKSMSYGPYKFANYEDGKQVVFVQNENWYGFEKDDKGNLISYADFEVDGEYLQQYVTTKVVIDVMTQEAAYQAFQKGELTDYAPTAQELLQYATSERLYKVDETYTMRWFFNTSVAKLQALDAEANNENSVVISNYNFRKAMSLAIDRADFVTATEGWKPAYSLMNNLYHYDIYNDPTSSYRSSDEAMQAIVDLYGVKYGPNEIYKTLEEAYENITGYNLTEAKALMKQAYTELTTPDENGNALYNGGDIVIQIGWAKGALTDADKAQLVLLNKYLNAALEGSGFGSITFTAADNIPNRYADTAAGKFAIGWGAWGGAAFYPFTMFRVYMDPSYADIHEAGCWSPETEELELTFTVDGETVTDKMTWQKWSTCMDGVGKYANASNETKLQITALLEKEYLNLYYCIPMAGTTICTLLSYQVDEYTENYNIMYGFGGLRFMKWNFSDAEWDAYVAEQGGTLNYK
jgi:oligopeptide transport system substrate-binding protein